VTEDQAIEEIARIAQDVTGVQLSARHRPMIQSRLQRRIDELGVTGLAGYLTHLKANFKDERKFLVALLTTHHTYFFREIAHFEYLRDEGLRAMVTALRAQGRRELRIWSAACSRGQEAYSLAMWILPWLKSNAPDISLKIFGSDIDADSVRIAKNGVYAKGDLDGAPLALLADHWSKGTGDIANFVKARDSLRRSVEFGVESLFELGPAGEKFDIIFCRNVFIYFNPEQITSIGRELARRLQPHGLLFVGISESLSGLGLEFDPTAPSAYRLRGAKVASPAASAPAPAAASRPVAAPPAKIRVLCVDDSPTILTLLKKILTETHGFQVVATALNGKEAAEKMKAGGIDLVTLDIHMPEMDGIQYLTSHFRAGHPPVVMVSSVSRENAGLATKALELGASDYVEKPSLADLNERAEEIRFKLKTALGSKAAGSTFDRQFAKALELRDPSACARVVFCTLAHWPKVSTVLKELKKEDPGTLVWIEGAGPLTATLAEPFAAGTGLKAVENAADLRPGTVAIADGREAWEQAERTLRARRAVSVMVFGPLSPAVETKLAALPAAQVLVEDIGAGTRVPNRAGGDVWRLAPTSFVYQSFEFFTKGKRAA
jgi:chemotaxis protein methyltransferase CheR